MVEALIDCHCHLEDEQFSKDLNQVILRAREYGIVMVSSGLGLAGATRALELSHEYKDVKCTIGFEPRSDRDPAMMAELIRDNSEDVIGVGEVGLDFYWGKTDAQRAAQERTFKMFIDLAGELSLPLVIHSRSAGERAIEILSEAGAKDVLMHAFDGKASAAMIGVEHGFSFSIPPCIIHSEQKQRLAAAVPLQNLCLESDAPVLGPDPRGRNEPVNILYSAKAIAKAKGVPVDAVIAATTQNAKRLFRI